jgi:hypothetical protein
MFLYQLVNLVLETCFIFSKTLNLSKTCFVLNFSSSSISRITSIMISLFQIIFRNSVQESVVSWIFLQSQLWCPSWIFDTSLSERCLNCWLVKINHDFWVSGVMLWINLKSIDMAKSRFQILFSFVFREEKV